MPLFARHLTGLFLGVPGFILWTAGWLGAIIHGAIVQGTCLSMRDPIKAALVIRAAAFLALGILGFAMLVAFELLVVGKRYRIAARRLAPCLGLELGVQFLFALSLVFVWGGILSAFARGTWSVVILELLFIATAIATAHLFNYLKINRQSWEREALTDERLVD